MPVKSILSFELLEFVYKLENIKNGGEYAELLLNYIKLREEREEDGIVYYQFYWAAPRIDECFVADKIQVDRSRTLSNLIIKK
jgi:hypothetical protein